MQLYSPQDTAEMLKDVNKGSDIKSKLKFSQWTEQETVQINPKAWDSQGLAVLYVGSIAGLIKRLS